LLFLGQNLIRDAGRTVLLRRSSLIVQHERCQPGLKVAQL